MRALRVLSICTLSQVVVASASAVTMEWALVVDPGNACDPQLEGCFGTVGYAYQIGTYEVTNSEYAEFLNAVAATDTNALYNEGMGSDFGGITRSGDPGSYSYAPVAGREDVPVNYVSFHDAMRFANWLENGQPTGVQGAGTTETGAYTITAQGIADNSITRNPGTTIFVPSEDEWYKAAYYAPVSTSYFNYPMSSDFGGDAVCSTPTATGNRANCSGGPGEATSVGSYPGSPSPYGTFDQGGNVLEWNETAVNNGAPRRELRGGSFARTSTVLTSAVRLFKAPNLEGYDYGLRVAPEPGGDLLLVAGLAGVFGLAQLRSSRPPRTPVCSSCSSTSSPLHSVAR